MCVCQVYGSTLLPLPLIFSYNGRMKKIKKSVVSPHEVKHVAHLARLNLTPKELRKFSGQLTKIFDYIGQIGEMKTEKVKETNQTTGTTNVTREDEIDTSRMFTQEEALSNAPASHNGYFKVKAIFDE